MNPSDEALQSTSQASSVTTRSTTCPDALARIGQAANKHTARNVFTDYLSRRAANAIRRQAADLQRFADFLDALGAGSGMEL